MKNVGVEALETDILVNTEVVEDAEGIRGESDFAAGCVGSGTKFIYCAVYTMFFETECKREALFCKSVFVLRGGNV